MSNALGLGAHTCIVLHRQQILRLQVIAFMPEDVVRVKDKGMKGALLLILRVNTVHDILVYDKPLPRPNQIGVVVGGNYSNALIHNQNFHLLMPVPADPVQIRFMQIQIAGVDRVVQCAVALFCIEIVIGLQRILCRAFRNAGIFGCGCMYGIHSVSSFVSDGLKYFL